MLVCLNMKYTPKQSVFFSNNREHSDGKPNSGDSSFTQTHIWNYIKIPYLFVKFLHIGDLNHYIFVCVFDCFYNELILNWNLNMGCSTIAMWMDVCFNHGIFRYRWLGKASVRFFCYKWIQTGICTKQLYNQLFFYCLKSNVGHLDMNN